MDEIQREPSRQQPHDRPLAGNTPEAMDFRKPRSGLPHWAWILIAFGSVFLFCGGLMVVGMVRYVTALPRSKPPAPKAAAVALAPNHDPNDVLVALKAGNYDQAILLADKLINDPTFKTHCPPKGQAAIYVLRGEAYAGKKEYEKALADMNETIRVYPAWEAGFQARAVLYEKMDQFAKAADDWSEAIRINPESESFYHSRGRCRLKLKEHASALTDFSESLKRNPDRGEAWMLRAICRMAAGSVDEAIADYSEAIRLGYKPAIAHRGRGRCQFLKKEYKDAVTDLTEAIRLNPKDGDSYKLRAQAYRALKMDDEANEDEQTAKKLAAMQ
jgi:tetratricopeptide (TPR) repeat protein